MRRVSAGSHGGGRGSCTVTVSALIHFWTEIGRLITPTLGRHHQAVLTVTRGALASFGSGTRHWHCISSELPGFRWSTRVSSSSFVRDWGRHFISNQLSSGLRSGLFSQFAAINSASAGASGQRCRLTLLFAYVLWCFWSQLLRSHIFICFGLWSCLSVDGTASMRGERFVTRWNGVQTLCALVTLRRLDLLRYMHICYVRMLGIR